MNKKNYQPVMGGINPGFGSVEPKSIPSRPNLVKPQNFNIFQANTKQNLGNEEIILPKLDPFDSSNNKKFGFHKLESNNHLPGNNNHLNLPSKPQKYGYQKETVIPNVNSIYNFSNVSKELTLPPSFNANRNAKVLNRYVYGQNMNPIQNYNNVGATFKDYGSAKAGLNFGSSANEDYDIIGRNKY